MAVSTLCSWARNIISHKAHHSTSFWISTCRVWTAQRHHGSSLLDTGTCRISTLPQGIATITCHLLFATLNQWNCSITWPFFSDALDCLIYCCSEDKLVAIPSEFFFDFFIFVIHRLSWSSEYSTLYCIFEVNKPEIQVDRLLCLLTLLANIQFWESSTVHCLYIWGFSQFPVSIDIQWCIYN